MMHFCKTKWMLIFLFIIFASKPIYSQTCKEVVGYYPNWQWYDRNKLVNPTSIDYSKYSILNYAFFDVTVAGQIVITDPWADKNLLLGPINWAVAPAGYDTAYDFGNPAFHHPGNKFSDICHQNGVKFLPSIGGWTLSNNFPGIAADPVKRQTFAQSCVELIDAFGFDGIDLDWEYPGYAPHNGTNQDKVNFTLLLQEIRNAIDTYGTANGKQMLLTIAVGASPERMNHVEWWNIEPIVDIINLMSYDYFGAWDANTNHNSPLFANSQGDPEFNLSQSVHNLIHVYGVSPNKITAGVAFYGRTAKTNGVPALFAPSLNQVDQITFPEDEGSPLYYNVIDRLHLFDEHWDNQSNVPYLTGKNGLNTFVSYDNIASITEKAQFIVEQNLRGAIIWEITGDYLETSPGSGIIHSTPLANALNDVFCNYTPTGLTVSFPGNQSIECHDATSQTLHPDELGWPVSSTDCSDVTIIIDYVDTNIPGNCINEYTINRAWTIQDNCGNSEVFVQTISVFDNTPPSVSCGNHSITELTDFPVILNEDFSGYYDPIDNCSENITMVQEPANGTELGIGEHEILLKFYDECGNWSECSVQYIIEPYSTAGLVEVSSGLQIFPNPCNDFFKIKSPKIVTEVTVINIVGQVVAHYPNLKKTHIEISSMGWDAGSYFIRIQSVDEEFVEKLIIQ
jgi:GH18 family chitinase